MQQVQTSCFLNCLAQWRDLCGLWGWNCSWAGQNFFQKKPHDDEIVRLFTEMFSAQGDLELTAADTLHEYGEVGLALEHLEDGEGLLG